MAVEYQSHHQTASDLPVRLIGVNSDRCMDWQYLCILIQHVNWINNSVCEIPLCCSYYSLYLCFVSAKTVTFSELICGVWKNLFNYELILMWTFIFVLMFYHLRFVQNKYINLIDKIRNKNMRGIVSLCVVRNTRLKSGSRDRFDLSVSL